MEWNLDNPGTEPSGALDVNQAGSLFSSMLDGSPDEPQTLKLREKAADPEAAQPVDTEIEAKADAAEPETEATEDDPTVTIRVDGKDVEVKLSELKNGYQRQADYTRKTMEVSETRKAAEAQITQAQQERLAYAQNLQRLQVQAEAALQDQQRIDWKALLDADPVEYLKQQHLAQSRQAALQQVYAEQNKLAAIAQAEQANTLQAHIKQQHDELIAKLPTWKDAAKAEAEKNALRDYLLAEGYDKQSVSNITDAKAVLLARKAMLYDQMVAKANVAAKKVDALPTKTLKPGVGQAPNLDRRSAAFQRLSKSGSVEDAAAVFSSLL